MPFFFEAAILSRMRSPVTSRSNWAKDSRMFRVSRPMELVVLNCWVTETKETPSLIEDFHDLGEVGERARQSVDLIDHDHVDLAGGRYLRAAAAARAAPWSPPEKPPSS